MFVSEPRIDRPHRNARPPGDVGYTDRLELLLLEQMHRGHEDVSQSRGAPSLSRWFDAQSWNRAGGHEISARSNFIPQTKYIFIFI